MPEATTIPETMEGDVIETRSLTIDNRCDKCGPSTRAYVRIIFVIDGEERPLDFCGSCFSRREPMLRDLIESNIVTLVDERAFIDAD